MTDLLFHVLVWPTFGIALLVFGFAPGALLRLIVLLFYPDDPRRQELRSELYHVPRIERLFWVAEQLEVALVEGLGVRLRWAATGRIIDRWHLGSGVESHREHPNTFWIPSQEEKEAIEPGVMVKLMFRMKDGWVERMWVEVTDVKKRRVVGKLSNDPVGIPRLLPGDKIKFDRDHIIDIDWPDEAEDDGDPAPVDGQVKTEVICGCRNSDVDPDDQAAPETAMDEPRGS